VRSATVQRCQEIPGEELFQYVDAEGDRHSIGSKEVNEYLREVTGQDFTAKDFRTWAGTALAAQALEEFQEYDSQAQAKRNIVQAIESVAKRLGNTKTICRQCYVHPAIIDSYLDGTLISSLSQRVETELIHGLHKLNPEEAAVLAFLQERLKHAQAQG
jgi:DNA topoisomerase-1